MGVVAVKNKFQIVIPRGIREQVRIKIGDLLEASVRDGRITFTPKSLVDRHIAEGLEDAKHGRTHGPYTSAREAIAALELRAKRLTQKRGRNGKQREK
jgi:AbrB family looped-hinge helix DNA binding protein